MTTPHIHATVVVIGEAGVLIRGVAGTGKSTLARRLVAAAERSGRFALLVGDDRVALKVSSGRLIARGHPAVSGTIEFSGLGILDCRHEPAAVIRLVVDLGEDVPVRMPEARWVELAGVTVPAIGIHRRSELAAETVLAALAR